MEKVIIINKKTGSKKTVNKSLAGDYLGTGEFKLYEEEKINFVNKPKIKFENKKEDK